ncbi:hypothetical protein PM082_023966 [Marasmius tenuissimus]|nr:hypothetical protein PM082_023966 [Marasmius tenuissimus]
MLEGSYFSRAFFSSRNETKTPACPREIRTHPRNPIVSECFHTSELPCMNGRKSTSGREESQQLGAVKERHDCSPP